MPGNFDFSVLISQVPRVQKIHGDIQQAPLSNQESLQREVEKKQEREHSEVESSSKGSGSDKVGDSGEKGGSRGQGDNKRRKGKEEQEQGVKAGSTGGHLIDIEV